MADTARAPAVADVQLHDFPSLFSLRGKTAVVTGGSRGLGLQAASALLQAGARTVFVSSRKADACAAACAALNALPNLAPGARAVAVPADSSTPGGVQQLVAAVAAHTDRVDVLLANAGATWGAELARHDDAAFAKVLDLNLRAVFNTVRDFAPLLERAARAAPDGLPSRVIVTASVAGLAVAGRRRHATFGYCASKAGVIHLARNFAVDLGPRGIAVNCISPGFFPTKMSSGTIDMAGGADAMGRGNPLGRLGRPDDIAGVVVYLASRAGAYVNGENIVVDGGSVWTHGGGLARADDVKL